MYGGVYDRIRYGTTRSVMTIACNVIVGLGLTPICEDDSVPLRCYSGEAKNCECYGLMMKGRWVHRGRVVYAQSYEREKRLESHLIVVVVVG